MYTVMQATIDRIRAAVDKHNLEVKSNEVKVNVRRVELESRRVRAIAKKTLKKVFKEVVEKAEESSRAVDGSLS